MSLAGAGAAGGPWPQPCPRHRSPACAWSLGGKTPARSSTWSPLGSSVFGNNELLVHKAPTALACSGGSAHPRASPAHAVPIPAMLAASLLHHDTPVPPRPTSPASPLPALRPPQSENQMSATSHGRAPGHTPPARHGHPARPTCITTAAGGPGKPCVTGSVMA